MKHGVKAFLIENKYLALYFQYVGGTIRSKSAVEELVHAIAWIHSITGPPLPTCIPFVTIMVKGLCRLLARPTTKKTPFNTEMLAAVVEDTHKNKTSSNVHLSTVCLLALDFMNCPSCIQQT